MIDEDQNMDLNLMLAGILVHRCSNTSAAHPQTRLTVNCLDVPQAKIHKRSHINFVMKYMLCVSKSKLGKF